MRKTILFCVVAAVAAAGCMPPVPGPSSTPNADPTSYTPGEAPKFGYQVDYGSKVELTYEGVETQDEDGNDIYDGSLFTLSYTWYPQGVSDDDVPYALQPYMQRAGHVRAGLGTGEIEPDGSDGIDSNATEFGFAVFNTETGLGFRAEQSYVKWDDGPAGSMGQDSLTAAVVWQDEDGFSAEFGLVKKSADVFFEELGVIFAMPAQTAYRAVRIGARKAFVLDNGQAIDLAGSIELGRFDMLKLIPTETGSNVYRFGVTYFPVKMLGIGLSYAARTFESDEDLGGGSLEDFESGEFGASLTLTVAERIDIGATYRSLEKDLPSGTGDLNEISEFGVTLGVRF